MGRLLKFGFVVVILVGAVTGKPTDALRVLYDGAFLSTLWSLWTTGFQA